MQLEIKEEIWKQTTNADTELDYNGTNFTKLNFIFYKLYQTPISYDVCMQERGVASLVCYLQFNILQEG